MDMSTSISLKNLVLCTKLQIQKATTVHSSGSRPARHACVHTPDTEQHTLIPQWLQLQIKTRDIKPIYSNKKQFAEP